MFNGRWNRVQTDTVNQLEKVLGLSGFSSVVRSSLRESIEEQLKAKLTTTIHQDGVNFGITRRFVFDNEDDPVEEQITGWNIFSPPFFTFIRFQARRKWPNYQRKVRIWLVSAVYKRPGNKWKGKQARSDVQNPRWEACWDLFRKRVQFQTGFWRRAQRFFTVLASIN